MKEKSSSNNEKPKRSKTAKNFYKKSVKVITENQLAVEETKKLYQKYYEAPNPLFLSQLKTDTINIYLSNYKFNDISVINKILNKYKYTKHLTLSPNDPMKSNSKKIRNKNNREPITEGEKVKLDKEAKDKQIEYSHIINKITLGIGKHLCKNEKLESFNLLDFEIDQKLAQNLSVGISNNNSIKNFRVNNCKMDIGAYEILLKGFFNHPKIAKLDLQKNNLGDKYGNMIGRIISRQTDRRDQVIWSYALRNEFPEEKDYKNGLIFINLNGNNLSSYAADCITTALAPDQYVRSIILSNNKFKDEDCKKFIYMLRRNMTLLNIDLSSNPGYNDNIQKRLIIKMSKNIKNLYIKYKQNEIDGEEFEEYKKYINSALFFKIDIPEDVVENYNTNNLNKIPEDDLNIENNNKENGMVLKDVHVNNNINILNKNNLVNKNKSKEIPMLKSQNKDKVKDEANTKKLMEENLLLKKKILELKAENLKNKSGKNIKIPNNYKDENLKKNFKQAEELLDELNNIMNKIENESNYKKNSGKKEIDNNNENSNNKIKIKNINLKENKEEKIINNNINNENSEKKKEKAKEKEKKDIKLNIDDNNNKMIFKKEENINKKNNIQYNKNINNSNNNSSNKKNKNEMDFEDFINKKNNKSDKKKDKANNKINKKEENKKVENKKEINKKEENKKIEIKKEENIGMNNKKLNLNKKEEEKEEEESENIDENDERILQHQMIFEQLKKQYEAKGMKFEMEDYLEMLQNPELFEEEEDENEGF